jgi:gamma-glutamyltranspeptidase/glutathione hydrolase
MTNHTGTVTLLYWEAATKTLHQLDSVGTMPADLPPCRPIPPFGQSYGAFPPTACIPGFMPGMKAMFERFASKPWSELCADAVRWAESGHEVSSFEYSVNLWGLDFTTYTPSGRQFYMGQGHLPVVGEIFRSEALAETMAKVRDAGPDYMISGPWSDKFIETANRIGWPIRKEHMTATPPRWVEPVRFKLRDVEIVGLAAPQRQGVHTAFMMGILDALRLDQYDFGSAHHLYLMAQALRWVERDTNYINDPEFYGSPSKTLLDPSYHRHVAQIIESTLPKVDLTRHVKLTSPDVAFRGAVPLTAPGLPAAKPEDTRQQQPPGSCELSVVDAQGNWVQMMNTLQGGGIPGHVIDGVPMVGAHVTFGAAGTPIDAKLYPGYRMRSIMGHTFVLKNGEPVFSLGTPGRPNCTVAQVLANYIFFGMSPPEAVDAVRILPLSEDGVVVAEDRVSTKTAHDLFAMGIPLRVVHASDWHMGSFQICWRDEGKPGVNTYADPRRCGYATGIPLK